MTRFNYTRKRSTAWKLLQRMVTCKVHLLYGTIGRIEMQHEIVTLSLNGPSTFHLNQRYSWPSACMHVHHIIRQVDHRLLVRIRS